MVTATLGDRSGTTHTGTRDARLVSSSPTTNFSTSTETDNDFLLDFDGLASITGPVTVSSATITLKCVTGDGGAATWAVRRLLVSWTESTATWNTRDGSTAWSTAGALGSGTDIDTTDDCTLSYPGGFSTADITSTDTAALRASVQGMINGTLSRNGWRVNLTGGNSETAGLPAHATAANRPLLTVVYTSASGGTGTLVSGGRLMGGILTQGSLVG